VRAVFQTDPLPGKQTKRIANTSNGLFQETQYVYAPSGSSGVQSYGLLSEVRYPDTATFPYGEASAAAEFTVSYTHNRLGQVVEMTDQEGTTREYTFDGAGRLTKDEVTTFGTGVDQWIDRIETTYDAAGRREYVRSKDGSTVKNAVQHVYDARGRLEEIVQDPDGDIGGGDDLSVEYVYDDAAIGSGNRSRLDELVYPDGSAYASAYGTAGSTDDLISRQTGILFPGGKDAVVYEHVGAGMPVTTSYVGVGFILDESLAHNGARVPGEYPGYDQFGRNIRHVWADDTIDEHASLTTVPNIPPVIELEMAYDKSSNRTRTVDARPGARREMRDEVYAYDGLDRLIEAERGEWSGSALGSVKGGQEWDLDVLGNWDEVKTDKNADGSFADDSSGPEDIFEIEGRVHIAANEIEEVTGGGGASPFVTADLENEFSKTGSMEKSRKRLVPSSDPDDNALDTYTFDAWNRLVEVEVGTTSPQDLASYEYNGLNWRTVSELDTDDNGSLDQVREMYYDASWRLLEERIDDDGGGWDRASQLLWGTRYIDDSVFQREGTNSSGSPVWDNPTYNLTGPMFSVLARMNGKTGQLLERVRYRPYGEARHQWGHDVDGDGDADSADEDVITVDAWLASIGDVGYDVDADLDRDGDVDSADETAWGAIDSEFPLADGVHSSIGAITSWSGTIMQEVDRVYSVRNRMYKPDTGRWISRDPAHYIDGSSLYAYGNSNPLSKVDPTGQSAVAAACCTVWANNNRDTSWTEDLPDCPCNLALDSNRQPGYGRDPGQLDPDTWGMPGDANQQYHPGARWCVRSQAIPGIDAGQQCCYDQDGGLITHGDGAGTPDRRAPGDSPIEAGPHFFSDVLPSEWCPTFIYHMYRPPNNGNDCDSNP